MKNLIPVEWSNQRVLTTRQLAEYYGTTTDRLKDNFRREKERFVEGVHYFKVEGENLRWLREQVSEELQKAPEDTLQPLSKGGKAFILYTLQGAARHAKMLHTQAAWDVFTELEESYFNRDTQKPVEQSLFAQNFSRAARNAEARDFEEFKKNPPEKKLDVKLLAEFLNVLEDSALKEKLVREVVNILIGRKIF